MSLNCLACSHILQRTDPESDGSRKVWCINAERSWSGNLTPPPYEKIRGGRGSGGGRHAMVKKIKKGHRRQHSTRTVTLKGIEGEPRLVRSCGMRRDWSFEDLNAGRKDGRNF